MPVVAIRRKVVGTNLQKGDQGPLVRELQKLLLGLGYPIMVDGIFGKGTFNAVRAYQSQHADQQGNPLVVDGKVGPLTWWSLTHPAPVTTAPVVDFSQMPSLDAGGSALGRAALQAAIGEKNAGAQEIGGNNRGPWVKKYLTPAGIPEGESWCASFVSWCYMTACEGKNSAMPFEYCPGARALLTQFKGKGWTIPPGSAIAAVPGDLVFWWRVQLNGWQGHVGLVHQVRDGILYTIEGNKTSRVQGFSYVLSRIDKLLGYAHVPD